MPGVSSTNSHVANSDMDLPSISPRDSKESVSRSESRKVLSSQPTATPLSEHTAHSEIPPHARLQEPAPLQNEDNLLECDSFIKKAGTPKWYSRKYKNILEILKKWPQVNAGVNFQEKEKYLENLKKACDIYMVGPFASRVKWVGLLKEQVEKEIEAIDFRNLEPEKKVLYLNGRIDQEKAKTPDHRIYHSRLDALSNYYVGQDTNPNSPFQKLLSEVPIAELLADLKTVPEDSKAFLSGQHGFDMEQFFQFKLLLHDHGLPTNQQTRALIQWDLKLEEDRDTKLIQGKVSHLFAVKDPNGKQFIGKELRQDFRCEVALLKFAEVSDNKTRKIISRNAAAAAIARRMGECAEKIKPGSKAEWERLIVPVQIIIKDGKPAMLMPKIDGKPPADTRPARSLAHNVAYRKHAIMLQIVDAIIGALDRNSNNFLLNEAGHVVGIDNDASFPLKDTDDNPAMNYNKLLYNPDEKIYRSQGLQGKGNPPVIDSNMKAVMIEMQKTWDSFSEILQDLGLSVQECLLAKGRLDNMIQNTKISSSDCIHVILVNDDSVDDDSVDDDSVDDDSVDDDSLHNPWLNDGQGTHLIAFAGVCRSYAFSEVQIARSEEERERLQ